MQKKLYFEDFVPGQVFNTAAYTLHEAECIDFARQYDPQYFHVDPEAARNGPHGRLIVSGWQTAAVSMRLKAASDLANVSGGLIGLGLETLKWPRAVFPGDTLSVKITILEKRRSASKPTHGVVKYRMDTCNQYLELVMETVTAVWVPCKN